MFTSALCAGFLSTALAADPVAAVQQRFPVIRTTITTASGSHVLYTLPADAPPELRRAYKGLEIAEREVLTSEALQMLEQEIVNNERKLEALRTYYLTYYLRSPNTTGPRFYGMFPYMPESVMRRAISMNVNRPWAADRAMLALDRLGFAQFQLQQVLNAIAHPGGDPGPFAAPADIPDPLANPAGLPDPVANPAGGLPAAQGLIRQAEQAAAKAEALAEKRERAARAKELAAEARYRNSLPENRATARQAWLDTRAEWEQARRNWDAARKNWEAARDRLDSQPSVPATPSARPTLVRSYPRTSPVVRSQQVFDMPAPYPLAQPGSYYAPSYRPPLSVPLMTIRPLR